MSTNLDRRPLGDDDLGSALRDAFRQGADGLPRTVDPWQRTTSAVRRSQVRRRTTALAVAATVAAIGVAGSLGALPSLRADRSQPAGRPQPGDVKVVTDDVATWPLRGDLAKDATATSAMKTELARQGNVVRLLYAGRVAGRQVGIAVLDRPDDTTGAATGATSGATQRVLAAVLGPTAGDDGWTPLGYPAPADGVVSLAIQQDDGSRDVLVLARTDAPDVAVSAAPLQDYEGRVTRTYTRLQAPDGVATTHLEPGAVAGVAVMAVASASTSTPGPVQLWTSPLLQVRPDQSILDDTAASPRCTGGTDATDVLNAVSDVSGNRDPLRVPSIIEPVWCRDVAGGRVGLFAVTLQDGTAYLAPIAVARSGAVTGTWKTVGIPIPNQATLTTPVVLPDLPYATAGAVSTDEHWFVHAPGASSVNVTVGDGVGKELFTFRPDEDGFTEVSLSSQDAQRVASGVNPRVVLRNAKGDVLEVLSLMPDLSERTLLAQELVGPVR